MRTSPQPVPPSDPGRTAPAGGLAAPDPYQLVWMEELRELLRGPRTDLSDRAHVEQLFVDWCCRWHATDPTERWDPIPSLNALGVAVGDLVRAARPDLAWRVPVGVRPTTPVLADAEGRVVANPLADVASWWMARELSGISLLLDRLAPPLDGWQPLAPPRRVRVGAGRA